MFSIFRKEGVGNYYRTKDLDVFFRELKFLIKEYNLDFIYISSETLLIIKIEKFKELARRYKEEINLPFWCQSRIDTFTDERTKMLKEMGCQAVSIGLEHGNEEFRKKILNKKITNKDVYSGFKTLAKYNIRPTVNSMMGLPDETRENIFETFEMNRNIVEILSGNLNLNVFTFIPFSGTVLRTTAIQKGYVNPNKEISFSFYKESILTMPSLSKKEISGLEKTAQFYILLPKSYYPDINIAEKDDEEGKAMFEKLTDVLTAQKKKKEALDESNNRL